MFWNFCQDFVDSYTIHVLGSSVKAEDWKQKRGRKIVRDLMNFTVVLMHVQWHLKVVLTTCS